MAREVSIAQVTQLRRAGIWLTWKSVAIAHGCSSFYYLVSCPQNMSSLTLEINIIWSPSKVLSLLPLCNTQKPKLLSRLLALWQGRSLTNTHVNLLSPPHAEQRCLQRRLPHLAWGSCASCLSGYMFLLSTCPAHRRTKAIVNAFGLCSLMFFRNLSDMFPPPPPVLFQAEQTSCRQRLCQLLDYCLERYDSVQSNEFNAHLLMDVTKLMGL